MKYSIDEVFKMLGEENLNITTQPTHSKQSITVEGFKVYTKSLRYATFFQKGCTCCVCGKAGTYFQLDPDRDGGNAENRRHFNLYAEDGTLMTKDHILPKRWGGDDHIDNLQTMCKDCNEAKGSQYDYEINGIQATDIQNPQNVKRFNNIQDAVLNMYNATIRTHEKLKRGTVVKRTVKMVIDLQEALITGRPYLNYFWEYKTYKVKGAPYNGNNI